MLQVSLLKMKIKCGKRLTWPLAYMTASFSPHLGYKETQSQSFWSFAPLEQLFQDAFFSSFFNSVLSVPMDLISMSFCVSLFNFGERQDLYVFKNYMHRPGPMRVRAGRQSNQRERQPRARRRRLC